MLRACLIVAAGALVLAGSACSSESGPAAYPTYQECFDDQTEKMMVAVEPAIVKCCLEHPIDGMTPACGATKPDCINYLTINLKQTSAGVDQVSTACTTYEEERNKPPM